MPDSHLDAHFARKLSARKGLARTKLADGMRPCRLRGGGPLLTGSGAGGQAEQSDGLSTNLSAATAAPSLEDQREAHGQGRGYSVRNALLSDAADLAALDAVSSPPHLLGLTEYDIRTRIQRFPKKQLVLCTSSGKIVGALYSQCVGSTATIVKGGWSMSHAFALHDADGPVRMLLAVQLAPTCGMPRSLSDILINCMLASARASPGVQKVIALAQCQSWTQVAMGEPSLKIEQDVQRGADLGLVRHTARGAKVMALIDDVDFVGVGVSVEYDLEVRHRIRCRECQPQDSGQLAPIAAVHPCHRSNLSPYGKQMAVQQRMRRDVEEAVRSVVQHNVDFDTPLMEAGVDSYRMQSFVQVR
jgi:hypothetical protein